MSTRVRTSMTHVGWTLLAAVLLPVGVVRADDELLKNPGFEEPEWNEREPEKIPSRWFSFSSTNKTPPQIYVSRDVAKEDLQSVRFQPQRVADAYQGLGQAIRVEPLEMYQFSVYVYVDPDDRMRSSVRGQLSIEWINERDVEVERTWGPAWEWTLAPGEWRKIEMTAQAHADAVGAVFVITHFDESAGRESGTFYIDDASVKLIPKVQP